MTKQFRPMKCSNVELDKLKLPVLSSTKYDGVYALVRDGQLLGRSLKPFKNKFITEQLSKPEYEGFVGELCFSENGMNGLFQEDLNRNTTSCVNTIEKEWEWVFIVFDYVHPDVIDLTYVERMNALIRKVDDLPRFEELPITWCELSTLHTVQEVEDSFQSSLEKGAEGIILRCPNGKWKNGRSTIREQYMLRMKPSHDAEIVVVSVVEAQENQNEATINELGYTERSSHQENKVGKGMIGALVGVDITTGNVITVGAGKLTHEERKECFENPPIGRIAKYKSMSYGVMDKPRHPRFISWRADEDMSDDLVSKVESIREKWC